MSQRLSGVLIEELSPRLDGGLPVKRPAGQPVRVTADVLTEGHGVLRVLLRYRQLEPREGPAREVPMRALGNDAFEGSFPVDQPGLYAYSVEAAVDPVATWADELSRKLGAGQEVRSELLEGAALLREAADRASNGSAPAEVDAMRLLAAVEALEVTPGPATAAAVLDPTLLAIAARHPDRGASVRTPEARVQAVRRRAICSAWYELFPRSTAMDARRHGSFRTAAAWLSYVKELGFDVLYLPPIHPIGRTARKGKNNALKAAPDDVGSPWAIGGPEGGHKAVHPQLGTLEDFRGFVKAAREEGLEVALDLAFQCSPDHPYVKEHPEWFQRRPDGTIKTAENPPKRYEDIVNFDWLGPAREAIWSELRSVVLHWIEQGVSIFRVDNPHTKPLPFWRWLIAEVKRLHPEAIFLAEAFTRPKLMAALARLGFDQSYTYFTWRNFKPELTRYLEEISSPPLSDFFLGNLWTNTPDILPEHLQVGGRAIFLIRAALAATLSPSWGIYSGYELCEAAALPGKEEYADSEKYQLVARDLDKPGNVKAFVAALNAIRKRTPALQRHGGLQFCAADNERVLFYARHSEDGQGVALVAVSLDPFAPQRSALELPLQALGIGVDETVQAVEELSGERALLSGPTLQVELTPERPARIWTLARFRRSERSFDYY